MEGQHQGLDRPVNVVIAAHMTGVDGQSSQRIHLSEYPSDVSYSRLGGYLCWDILRVKNCFLVFKKSNISAAEFANALDFICIDQAPRGQRF